MKSDLVRLIEHVEDELERLRTENHRLKQKINKLVRQKRRPLSKHRSRRPQANPLWDENKRANTTLSHLD